MLIMMLWIVDLWIQLTRIKIVMFIKAYTLEPQWGNISETHNFSGPLHLGMILKVIPSKIDYSRSSPFCHTDRSRSSLFYHIICSWSAPYCHTICSRFSPFWHTNRSRSAWYCQTISSRSLPYCHTKRCKSLHDIVIQNVPGLHDTDVRNTKGLVTQNVPGRHGTVTQTVKGLVTKHSRFHMIL